MLDSTPNQPTKFRTKNWVKINDDERGTYRSNSLIKFKTSMLRSILCDYSDAYVLVNVTITITGEGADDAEKRADEWEKGVIFKSCVPFDDCISEINNNQIDNAKYLNVVMPINNLIEYSNNYSKTSGSLLQYYRDEPNNNITEPESFQFKVKITGKTSNVDNEKENWNSSSIKTFK